MIHLVNFLWSEEAHKPFHFDPTSLLGHLINSFGERLGTNSSNSSILIVIQHSRDLRRTTDVVLSRKSVERTSNMFIQNGGLGMYFVTPLITGTWWGSRMLQYQCQLHM